MAFMIEYRSDKDVIATTPHPGPLAKAEIEITIGLLRYLMSGVTVARILDQDGREVLNMPTPMVQGV